MTAPRPGRRTTQPSYVSERPWQHGLIRQNGGSFPTLLCIACAALGSGRPACAEALNAAAAPAVPTVSAPATSRPRGSGRIGARGRGATSTATAGTAAADTQRFVVSELRVEGDNPLPADDVNALLLPYLGEHEGLLGLQGAAEALEELLRERGYAFHRVTIPQQRTSTGSIRFVVRASRIGTITIEGAEHYDAASVRDSLPALREGESANSRVLGRNLELTNAHPTRKLGLSVKKSARPGYLDATLKVTDSSPHQFFATMNNRGSEETGEGRLALGYQHSDLFGADHALTLTYTTSPGHWNDVAQYGANYSVPFYTTGGSLSAFYSYSDVDSGTIADFFQVSGKGKFAGLRYLQLLLPYGNYRHRAELSVEDRLFDNNVDFRGRPIGIDVRSRPAGLRYHGEWVYPNANVGFDVSVSTNLGGGKFNDDDAYNATRLGADPDWVVYRYGANADYSFDSRWLLRGRLTGQYSQDPLISGEQLGFGGADSLRGYDERIVAVDRGVQANAELWAPPLLPNLSLLAFVDAGFGKREQAQPGEARTLTTSSVGLGVRFRPNARISLSFDYGVVTNGAGSVNAGDSGFHLNLLVR